MKVLILYTFLIVLFCGNTFGQTGSHNKQLIEDLVEEIASGSLVELDYTEVVEDLTYYAENPLNINVATQAEFESLWALNTFQVQSIIYYRRKNGGFSSIYELALIDGFDFASIQRIIPFIQVSEIPQKESLNAKQAFRYGHHSLFLRAKSLLETPTGYRNSEGQELYLGNKTALYSRYQFNYKKKLQFGFITEKDAGEPMFHAQNPYGFDFYAVHFQLKDVGWVKNLVVGDYSVQFGQGVIIWSALRNAKSVYALNIIKHGAGLKRYTSTNENLFLRGVGVTLGNKQIELSIYASQKQIDAKLQIDTTINTAPFFTNLTQDGIHATNKAFENKDAIKESIIGSHLQWKNTYFKIGFSGIAYRFDHALIKPDVPREYYSFMGEENYNVGSNAQFRFKGIHVFGELGMSKNKATGLLLGSLLKMTDRASVSILYRNYQKDYHALYAGAFAENSYNRNEKGIYLGTELSIVKKWRLRAYYDFYQFPWLKSGVSSPSEGYEYLVQAEFVSSRNLNMYWRFRSKTKQKDGDVHEGVMNIPQLVPYKSQQLRYQINYRINDKWEFKNRLELSSYYEADNANQHGYLLYQDVSCSPFRFPLSFAARYAIFETDSYNARLYAYESDLLYVNSIIPYYNSGTRTYLMLKYKLGDHIDFWLRFGQFWYADTQIIGSGMNTIHGRTKSSVKFQVRMKI